MPWSRPHFEPGGPDAHVVLVAFTDVELAGLTVSRSRHGVPDAAERYPIRLDDVVRVDAPAQFSELEDEALLALADDEGLDVDALRAASRQVRMVLSMPDPEDCEYLRLAWSFARAVCEAVPVHGVLDRHARRWWTSARLAALPPDPESLPDLSREISTLLLTEPDPRFGHVCHTLGLRKFGRPDLVIAGLSVQHGTMAADLLHELARRQALGERLRPGQRLSWGWFSGRVEALRPGVNVPALHLDNAGLVLRPDPSSV